MAAISSSAEEAEREGEDRPPAQARLRAGHPVREPCRLREQVVEASLWNRSGRLLGQALN